MLVNKRDVIEVIVDTGDIRETGAWILVLSNGLETGSKEPYAGVSGMDYKLEDGTLSRYTGEAGNPWRAMANLKVQHLGTWQVQALPKLMFLKPESRLEWRAIFFPHGAEPRLLPAEAPGSLDLGAHINAPPSRSGDLPFEYFAGMSGNAHLAIGKAGVMRMASDIPAHKPGEAFDRTVFSLPTANCIAWPDTAGPTPLASDIALGHRRGPKFGSVLFDTLDLPEGPRGELIEARLQACRLAGIAAYFRVRGPQDAPSQATGLVFNHGVDLKSDILAMQKLREGFKGPMWVQVDDAFWKLEAADRGLVAKAWLLFDLLPLLPPGRLVEDASHRQAVFLMWHMLHVEHMLKGGRRIEDHLPIPTDANNAITLRRRRLDPDAYVAELRAGLERAFLSSVRGGS